MAIRDILLGDYLVAPELADTEDDALAGGHLDLAEWLARAKKFNALAKRREAALHAPPKSSKQAGPVPLGPKLRLIGMDLPNLYAKVFCSKYSPTRTLDADFVKTCLALLGERPARDNYILECFKEAGKRPLYGGWIYARQMNPSDDFLTGFPTIAQGIFIPPGSFNKSGVFTNSAVTVNNFDIQKVLNTFWFGARWKIRSDLEAMGGFYYQNQNNFNPAACTGGSAFISSAKCGGSQDGISFLLDWKPVKRVDIYAGVLLSNVYGGLANVFFSTSTTFIPGTTTAVTVNTARTQNYDPTVGIRIRF